MIIGHYVSHVAVEKGYERNVSGHVQTPLQSMRLLKEAGHEVHLITNAYGDDRVMPDFMPQGVAVHCVVDARKRGGLLTRTTGQKPGVKPLAAVRQAREIIDISRRNRFDILHLYGHNRTAHLGGALKLLGLEAPAVMTLITQRFPERLPRVISQRLWRRLEAVVTATDYVKGKLREEGIESHVARHGAIRRFEDELAGKSPGQRHRVLFWRNATDMNGADIAMRVFDELAPKHPDISFDLAVRPHVKEIEGLEDIPARHPNVHLHRFPYKDGLSLAELIFESICVLMPMRRHTIDPQLSIVESMEAETPVIASDLNSTPELIRHGHNGMLIPVGDAEAAIGAVSELLRDRERAREMGRAAAEEVRANWSWDRYFERLSELYGSILNKR